jgi:hypothetical protein
MNNTAILTISRKDLDCNTVLDTLLKCGIKSHIEKNKTIMCDSDNNCWLENGCKITQTIKRKNEIVTTWKVLQKLFVLNCAHLKIDGAYSGCILDFEKETSCN